MTARAYIVCAHAGVICLCWECRQGRCACVVWHTAGCACVACAHKMDRHSTPGVPGAGDQLQGVEGSPRPTPNHW
jgi:hypothetical protein